MKKVFSIVAFLVVASVGIFASIGLLNYCIISFFLNNAIK